MFAKDSGAFQCNLYFCILPKDLINERLREKKCRFVKEESFKLIKAGSHVYTAPWNDENNPKPLQIYAHVCHMNK